MKLAPALQNAIERFDQVVWPRESLAACSRIATRVSTLQFAARQRWRENAMICGRSRIRLASVLFVLATSRQDRRKMPQATKAKPQLSPPRDIVQQ